MTDHADRAVQSVLAARASLVATREHYEQAERRAFRNDDHALAYQMGNLASGVTTMIELHDQAVAARVELRTGYSDPDVARLMSETDDEVTSVNDLICPSTEGHGRDVAACRCED